MMDLVSYFQQVNAVFWGENIYHWWFYFSIILILIIEKNRTIKIIFGWYSIAFLIGIFNPLTYRIITMFTGGVWQYYARLFSMLLVPQTIGLGTVLLIEKITTIKTIKSEFDKRRRLFGRLLKFHLAIGACILMIVGGTDVYKQDWMKPAQNVAKVPNEAIWICQNLHKDTGVTIAVPGSLSPYIRQIDASFYMPYGRYLNALGNALSTENPDPWYVMEEGGKEGCDYIVVLSNEKNRVAFKQCGWEPEDEIGQYLVYAVKNVNRLKKYYDAKHHLIKVTSLNADGQPVPNSEGYSSVVYEYDNNGNKAKETYLDSTGNFYLRKGGYCSISRTYTRISNRVETISYLDATDQPVCINGCYLTKYYYNEQRRIVKEKYYDANGNGMIRKDNLYGEKTYKYDAVGRIIGERFFNENGEPVLSASGYAGYDQEYDERGNISAIYFMDFSGEGLKTNVYGYAIIRREWNDNKQMIKETHYDINGELVNDIYGVAIIERVYNDKGIFEEIKRDSNGDVIDS